MPSFATSHTEAEVLESVTGVVVVAEESLVEVVEVVDNDIDEVKPCVVEWAGLVNGRTVAEETNPPKFSKLFAFSQKHFML